MFDEILYIKIYPNKLVAREISSGRTTEVVPASEFSHPRLLVGEFSEAEKAMKSVIQFFKSANPLKGFRLLMHPIAEFPGGICEAEERLFRLLAYEARASQVVLWVGPELSDEQVLQKIRSAR
jgi:hypothetical protein